MRRAVVVAVLLGAGAAAAATPGECLELRKRGNRNEARACFQSLTTVRDPYVMAEGLWGLGLYEEAKNAFQLAVKADEKNARYRVRWGDLFFDRYNFAEAASLYQEALELDEKNADAYLGLARVNAEGYDNKAVEMAVQALELDPKLVEARELLAHLALEDSNTQRAIEQADQALKLSAEALGAMAARAAVEVLADRSPEGWFRRMAAVNPVYGKGRALVAHHLMLNRRYSDAIDYYRKAIELEPDLWSARSQLGINLMRIGEEEEARRQLEICWANGWRDAATANTLNLLESYKNYVTYTSSNTIVRVHRKEAELLRPYVEGELKRAIATFEKKYNIKLPRPVQLELYPNHEDFAVRTMGMPGLGALGVTFGDVVAMDSPSGRKPGSFHWASTLWHELSHVFAIEATNHRVPRWFTEGLAVHEETAASPDWGDRITPEVLVALREKRLLGIAELDRGFIRPSYPTQVVVSYFQAGRICDYIAERWGFAKILEMMRAFAELKTTEEVVRAQLGMQPEEFDKQFLAWLERQTGATVAGFDEWRKRLLALAELHKSANYEEVIRQARPVIDMYPDYVEGANAYEMLANAYLVGRKDKENAAKILAEYARVGGRSPAALKELASIEQELGRPKEAAAALDRLNLIYLHDEEQHRRLGDLWFEQGNYGGAIREYGAVVSLNPIDKAAAHYNLARAYHAGGQRPLAEEHVLLSLEAAPGYRPAQRLLLELQEPEDKDTQKVN